MDFGCGTRTIGLRERLLAFMDEHVYPAEAVFDRSRRELRRATTGRGGPQDQSH